MCKISSIFGVGNFQEFELLEFVAHLDKGKLNNELMF